MNARQASQPGPRISEQCVRFSPCEPAGSPADLEQAVGTLVDGLRGEPRLTILINDPQRDTPTRSVLAVLFRHFHPARARILVAAGSHVYPGERRRAFEAGLLAGWEVADLAWHDARDESLQPVDGWKAHPWLLEAGALLAIGSVEPHYFAGFTGSHKTATIGCAARDDIERNHAHALRIECQPARLHGNPVHEGVAAMLRSLQARRSVSAVNLVHAGSKVSAVSAGEPLEALRALVPAAEQAFLRRVASPADAVVAEVSGALGRTFYQADKGIKNNEWAVRDGGVFILCAACEDGIGEARFVELLRQARTHEEALAAVQRQGYRLGDHKAVRLRYLTDPTCRGVRLFLVTAGLGMDPAQAIGFAVAPTVEEALRQAGVDPSRHRVIHVQDAGNLCVLPAGFDTAKPPCY